ncbi:hypothetical protein [Vitiosangium sp. GDMCC 1.1324]|uniref:hypothetical protein n=1 Tax=Vitiosangium sp. (strain GDMCC 1.1324) TaxID=2138576 RepID=UPI000D3C19F5|nr:hypothetical protein [Vitiosangium sp. GDMCC 1.1324]PTL80312.1 hypothetical protein DAT35_30475 [Vitiosangium sp. GDMCC 1.1324]
MKSFTKSLLASAAVLTLMPLSALALPLDCDDACTDTTPCSDRCAIPWSFQVVTCGKWLDYDPSSSCAPGVTSTEEEESATVTQDSADGSEWECRESAQAELSQPAEG